MAIQPRGAKFAVKVGGKYYGTRNTRPEAEAFERRVIVEREDNRLGGLPSSPPKVATCAEFANDWIEVYCPDLQQSTLNGYRDAMRRFAADFGKTPLTGVTRPIARKWAVKQPYGVRAVVRNMFNSAVDDGIMPTNPFAKLGMPQSKGRRNLVALTATEVHELADAADGFMHNLILFAAYTAMRPGEIYALKWTDIEGDRIHVQRSLSLGKEKAPKNGEDRWIVLPPRAAEAIRDLPRFEGVPYVFTSPSGRRLNPTTVQYHWNPIRAKAGRRGMDFYELRHFCATFLLGLGLSHADVAVQLGHRDGGALVMSTYGHPSEDESRKRIAQAFAA